jgi:hypothetical protein
MPDEVSKTPAYFCHSLPGLNRLLEVTRVLAFETDLAKILDLIVVEAC